MSKKESKQKHHQRIYSDDKHTKIYSSTLVFKEMNIKTTKKGHYYLLEWQQRNKINKNTNSWQYVGQEEFLSLSTLENGLINCLINKYLPPYNSESPPLNIYSIELRTYSHQNLYYNVYNNVIHSCLKLRATNICIHMDISINLKRKKKNCGKPYNEYCAVIQNKRT